MIPFELDNLFPHLAEGTYTYQEAKAHAVKVDKCLGFRMSDVESSFIKPASNQETWQHLDVQSFQTPYVELRTILSQLELKPGSVIADLGCAYARMAHVVGRHFPEIHFRGYELVQERVTEAQRVLATFQYSNVEVICWDLAKNPPAFADAFFIYDYGSKNDLERTLEDLQSLATLSPIHVIARGRATRHFIHKSHPWLFEVSQPKHFENYSIYLS